MGYFYPGYRLNFALVMKFGFLFFSILTILNLSAQRDSVNLNEVVITATKTERSLVTIPMPVPGEAFDGLSAGPDNVVV